MTTIATDGKSMAADGRSCCDSAITDNGVTKLKRLKNGGIAGWCGKGAIGPVFFRWLNSKAAQKKGARFPHADDDSSGLVLNPDGTITFWGSCGFPFPRSAPAADGSGHHFAVGAMDAGASPECAVEIASHRDPGTGGKIMVLKLREVE